MPPLTSPQGCAQGACPLCGESSPSLHCTAFAFAVLWLPGVTGAQWSLTCLRALPSPAPFLGTLTQVPGTNASREVTAMLAVCTLAVPSPAFLLAGEIQHIVPPFPVPGRDQGFPRITAAPLHQPASPSAGRPSLPVPR